MKKHIRIYALLLMLMPLLSGCFQQAGEAFQPANSTEAPITIPPSPTTETIDGGNTLPATDIPIATDVPNLPENPTSDGPEIDMTIISPTRSFGVPTATLETVPTNGDTVPTVETQTFRTPVSPLGQVEPNTPAPPVSSTGATATPSGLITPTALPGIGGDTTSSGGECTYTIQSGDTLFRVAVRNNTTVDEIAAANPGINPNLIQPGQVINLPGCTPGATGNNVVPTTEPDTTGNVPTGSGTTYTVQPGDTLFAIAQRFGITVQDIVSANSMTNPNNLSVGQELIIPAGS